jgi:hypothetical protein
MFRVMGKDGVSFSDRVRIRVIVSVNLCQGLMLEFGIEFMLVLCLGVGFRIKVIFRVRPMTRLRFRVWFVLGLSLGFGLVLLLVLGQGLL